MADHLHILLNPYGHGADAVRAARIWAGDELTRLLAEVERLTEVSEAWQRGFAERGAQLERLTERADMAEMAVTRLIGERDALRAEVEQSDAALQRIGIALCGTDEWTDRATMLGSVVAVAEEFRGEVERLTAERNNLLARIHRDGGQYTGEHGVEKSLADADRIVAELFGEVERLTAGPNFEEVEDILRGQVRALTAELEALARWKSTHAPRIEALEGLLASARAEAAKGVEAIATLESERAANVVLTAEVEALRADAERLDWLEDEARCSWITVSAASWDIIYSGRGKVLREGIDAARSAA